MIKSGKNAKMVGKLLVFLSILSFFCGDLSLNIGFTLRPFHIVAFLSFIYLIIARKHITSRAGLSRVDKAFIVFFLVTSITVLFSPFSVINSLKHLIGVALLAFSFYVFKRLYSSLKSEEISKIISIAGLVIIAVTLAWYLIGLITLKFNFNIGDLWCYGVRVDRKVPRLISFAYNEPNFVSIYFSILFAFYLNAKRNVKNSIGLIGSLAIIILTLSRGGYLAFAFMMIAYYLFAKVSIKEKLQKTAILIIAGALSFASATFVLNKNNEAAIDSTSSQPSASENISTSSSSNDSTDAVSLMTARFSSLASDNGSGRMAHWKNAVNTFKTHPVTGVGPGNILDYNEETYGRRSPSHNSFLDILAEQGLVGLAAYLVLIVAIVLACWKIRSYTIMPAMSFLFLFVSELFLSLAITDMLFINILMLNMCEIYWLRKKNSDITSTKKRSPRDNVPEKNNVLVSFVVPVYNVSQYIERCLTSLANQSGVDYEVIIVDDGSTDDSSKICEKISSEHKQMHYYRTSNHGLSAARNYGLAKSHGLYVWFVDGDDFLADDALDRLRKTLHHDIVCIGYYNYYDDENITNGSDCELSDNISRYLINPAFAQMKIVKRSILTSNKVQFENGRHYEDVGLTYGLIRYTNDVVHSGERVYFYRRRSDSISASFSDRSFKDHAWAIEQIRKSTNKQYAKEVEYQIVLQFLFALFDIDKNCKNYADYCDIANQYLTKYYPNCTSNKYLAKKTKKTLFFRFYTSLLMRKKYRSLLRMNALRKVLIHG